jgi:hypothetical protein
LRQALDVLNRIKENLQALDAGGSPLRTEQ